MNNNLHALLDAALVRSIPHIANLAFIKETIQQMKIKLDSYNAVEEILDEMILKEQDQMKCTDLKILQMFLTRTQR